MVYIVFKIPKNTKDKSIVHLDLSTLNRFYFARNFTFFLFNDIFKFDSLKFFNCVQMHK